VANQFKDLGSFIIFCDVMKVEVWRLVVSLGREGLGAKVEGATCSEWRVYKVGARSQIRGRQLAA
jgi:hypothetical protein